MKLLIESDGTIQGTRVVNAETGELIEHELLGLTWQVDRPRYRNFESPYAQVSLTFARIPVRVVGEANKVFYTER